MEQLSFTANRFKTVLNTEEQEVDNQDDSQKHQQQQDFDDNQALSCCHLNRLPLLESTYYSINNQCEKLPELRKDESIVSFKAVTDSIAIIITSQRVLVFNFKTFEKRPYTFQFEYKVNIYNILPLVSIIPNILNPLKPDLVIIDPITGILHFFESIKLAPSLSILQNGLQDKITLYNAEFLSNIQLFQDNSLLITTSQKRIIHVTFKDQFNDIAINFKQIYNNRPLISFMLSKSYSVREYLNSNRIISIRTFDISPVSKNIIILESTGRVAFINHLKGSSTFTLEAKYDLNLILSNSNFHFLNFQFIDSKKTGVFLVIDHSTNLLKLLYFDMYDLKIDPILVLTANVPSIPDNEFINNPNMFLLNDENSLLVQSNNRLVVFNINLNQLSYPWTEVVILNDTLHIYSLIKLNSSADIIYISTNKGLISFKLKSYGKSSDTITYLKDHLIQYLNYSTSSSPIVFNLKETLLPITESDKRFAIDEVLNDLLMNKSKAIEQNLNTADNLSKKVQVIKKLVIYVSKNYSINEDEELKIKIINTCELFSLTEKFYELIIDRNLIKPIMLILDKEGFTLDQFCQNSPQNILLLISKYVEYAKSVGNEVQLRDLASLLSTLFIDAFIKLDDYIKQYLTGIGLSTVFIDHFDLISNINNVTGMVYNLNLSDNEMITKYGEILVQMSCFLYYATNEIIIYMESHRSTVAMDKILSNYKCLLETDKNKWIHSFIVLKKQNDIIPLVNKYRDYFCLSSLLESKRETIQTLYDIQEISDIEFTNLSTDIEIEFDNYFDQYGYPFAEALFSYYIKMNKLNILLTYFEKHSDLIDKFFESDINCYSFAWIHDIKNHRFNNVSNKMLNFVSTKSQNTIHNFKLQSSLAKLATLCSEDSTEVKQHQIDQYNCSLSLISLQEYMKAELTKLGLFLKNYDQDQLCNSEYIKSNNFNYFSDQIYNIFKKLINDVSLTITEIITLISLASFKVDKKFLFDDKNNQKAVEADKVEISDSYKGLESDEDMEEEDIPKTITEEFMINIYLKIFQFIESYSELRPSSGIVTPNSSAFYFESENQRRVWKKLLVRRLFVNPDWQRLSNHILAQADNENIKIETKTSSLIIYDNELKLIGILDPIALSDYEKENKLLTSKIL